MNVIFHNYGNNINYDSKEQLQWNYEYNKLLNHWSGLLDLCNINIDRCEYILNM